jgi:large subunit ribosomal protein L22
VYGEVYTKMSKFGYAFQNFDSSRHVRASLREKQISHKHAREIAHHIKGFEIEQARDYLQAVINKERAVPFKRYKTQVGHKSDPQVMSGRYPQKAAKEFIKLLDNLESNAEYKGMDLDRLKIINVTTHKGVMIKRFIQRAFGRASPKNNVLTHIEIVAKEV